LPPVIKKKLDTSLPDRIEDGAVGRPRMSFTRTMSRRNHHENKTPKAADDTQNEQQL
jgi:hypothetical protein